MKAKLISIGPEPIELAAIHQHLADPNCGAALVFSGAVRAQNSGRAVQAVTFDAFLPLARQVLNTIGDEVLQLFSDVKRLVIAHRTGKLAVSELVTVSGVASAHRAAGYEASRYIIEQLKLRAPIWKEEHYLDGESSWLEGSALTPAKLAVVILAGGLSSRMGRNKALLRESTARHRTLLERAAARAAEFLKDRGEDPEHVFVSGDYPDFRSIADRILQIGPLGGIDAALEFLRGLGGQWRVLFLPVDMPELTPESLTLLTDREPRAAAVHFTHCELPLIINHTCAASAQVKKLIALPQLPPSQLSIRRLLVQLNSATIDLPAELAGCLVNMNTPADFQHWLQRAAS